MLLLQSDADIGVQHSTAAEIALMLLTHLASLLDLLTSCLWNAESLSSWQSDRLSRQEELRFSYEEEGAPQDFFVPYVWSLVVSSTTIPWNLHAIALFQPVSSSNEDVHVASQQLQQLTVEQTNGSDNSAEHHV